VEVSRYPKVPPPLLQGKETMLPIEQEGGWVDPRAGLDSLEKKQVHPLLGFKP